jgi:uncharacterized integral membrane protein
VSRRTTAWLAWSLLALSVLLYVLFLVLGLTPSASVTGMSYFQASDVLVSIAFLDFVPVGALIASRHPGNAIGWILCTIGLLVGVQFFAG